MEIKFTVDRLVDAEELDNVEFTGSVTIDMPPFQERAMFPTKIGLAEYKAEKGEAEEVNLKNGLKQVEMIAKGAGEVMPYIRGCELTSKEDGTILTTTEELFCHPGAQDIVRGIISGFLFGFNKKKKKVPSEASSAPV